MLPEPNTHPSLFGQLMDGLAKQVPTQLHSLDGELTPFKLELSKLMENFLKRSRVFLQLCELGHVRI